MDLKPNSIESVVLLTGKEVKIPKCSISFKRWQGRSILDSYGGKQVIDFLGEPLFAELVILRIMQKNGWQGVWVDVYGKGKYRTGLPENSGPVVLPPDQNAIIEAIKIKNGSLKGCWDVYAWNSNKNMFIESKRLKKDALKDSQRGWLQTAIDLGFPLDSFLLVEWDLSADEEGRSQEVR